MGNASAGQYYVPPKLQSTTASVQQPKPVVRGQGPDERPAVRIPTPEELGLGGRKGSAAADTVDWTAVERKLDALGATGFQIERTTAGYRFSCRLPAGTVAGTGATRAEAVQSTLAKVVR